MIKSITILEDPMIPSNAKVSVRTLDGWKELGILDQAYRFFDTKKVLNILDLKIKWNDGVKPNIFEVIVDNSLQKSNNATLSGITIGGELLKGFDANIQEYTYELAKDAVEAPIVGTMPAKNTTGQAVEITQAKSTTGSAVVVVTAEDGTTHKTYTIKFNNAGSADNSVQKSNNATLSGITIGGKLLKGFDANTQEYTYELAKDAVEAAIVGTISAKNTTGQAVEITQAKSTTGSAVIVVTAEDGTTHKTYTIKFNKNRGAEDKSSNSSSKRSKHKNSNRDNNSNNDKTISKVTEKKEIINGWNEKENGNWKYIENGKEVTGWKQMNNKWYYMDNLGVMQTGWKQMNNKWYYMDDSGVMQTGWKQINNKWYYMDDSGVMQTGWEKVNNKWYYLKESGDMATDWIKNNEKWYYLDQSGSMTFNTIIDGYKLGEDGALI